MNLSVLNPKIQAFINTNLKADVAKLLLKGIPFKNVSPKEVIEQIDAKKRSEKKLPTWFLASNIYYPNKLHVEQSSSELTANYKSKLILGDSLIDITGGFGVDCFYFSKQFKTVLHCETNTQLSKITQHNFKQLKINNVKFVNTNGIEVLKHLDRQFSCIYIDPSRRNQQKDKVFLITDCSPNIKTFQGLFLKYAPSVLIKLSPLLDIKATLLHLKHVKTIHIIAVNNEVKELLFILERNFKNLPTLKTVNILKETQQVFKFTWGSENDIIPIYSAPLTYLYEPNAAILKSGGFNLISKTYNVKKLHQHSHLYTTENLIDFPGRCFKIVKTIAFNKKLFTKEKILKANVTVRNFPLGVHDIRKKLNIKDGGKTYLFFTTNYNSKKIIIICEKVS